MDIDIDIDIGISNMSSLLIILSKARKLAAGLMTELETRGTVTVKLLDGANLKAADKGGTSDPYVVLDLNNVHRKSVLFLSILHVIQLKPRKLSAGRKNRSLFLFLFCNPA